VLPVPHSASNDERPVVVVHEYPEKDVDDGVERDRDLEHLWYSLCEPTFVPVTLVPVPGVEGASVVELAGRLARVGAWISGSPAVVIDALELIPPDVDAAASVLEQYTEVHPHLLVVVESPTVEPTSIPILRASRRIVLVVGLGDSRSQEIASIEHFIEPHAIFGAVCVDPSRT